MPHISYPQGKQKCYAGEQMPTHEANLDDNSKLQTPCIQKCCEQAHHVRGTEAQEDPRGDGLAMIGVSEDTVAGRRNPCFEYEDSGWTPQSLRGTRRQENGITITPREFQSTSTYPMCPWQLQKPSIPAIGASFPLRPCPHSPIYGELSACVCNSCQCASSCAGKRSPVASLKAIKIDEAPRCSHRPPAPRLHTMLPEPHTRLALRGFHSRG